METTEVNKKGLYRWIVLAILVFSFTSTFLSRFIWAPVIGTASQELGFSMAQAGNLMSGFYFGYLFTQIPGGFLADKFRVKYMLFGCVALVAVMTLSMAYVDSYTIAYAVRFVGGLVSGAIMAFCSRLLSNYFEPRERGIAFGILLASPSLGSLLANQIGPRVMNEMGWRSSFQVAGAIILIIAILGLVIIKEQKIDQSKSAASKTSFTDGLKNYFSNVQILILSLAGFLFMAIPAGYITWANKFITGATPAGAGLSPIQAGTIVTFYSIFSIIGSMSSGFIGKKFNINPKTFIMVVYALIIVTLYTFSQQTTYMGLLLASSAFGLVSCASSTHITYWAVNIGGNKYAATTTSTQNLIFQIANVIFPTVAGSIIDKNTMNGVVTSYMGVWYMYIGLIACALVVIFFASKKSALEAMK